MPYLVLIIVLLMVSTAVLVLYARRSRNFTITPRTTSPSALPNPGTSWHEWCQARDKDYAEKEQQ
jgi:hypothetical protein